MGKVGGKKEERVPRPSTPVRLMMRVPATVETRRGGGGTGRATRVRMGHFYIFGVERKKYTRTTQPTQSHGVSKHTS